MLHPSYADLMKVVNSNVEEGEEPVVSSRYSIVMATSKRARQIISGDDVLVENYAGRKPLSAAIEELNQAKIRILNEDEGFGVDLFVDSEEDAREDAADSDDNPEADSDAVSAEAGADADAEEPISNGEE